MQKSVLALLHARTLNSELFTHSQAPAISRPSLGTYWAQTALELPIAALIRIRPPTEDSRRHYLPRPEATERVCDAWGGWGSNPGPADYERAGRQPRAPCRRRSIARVPGTRRMHTVLAGTRSTIRSTALESIRLRRVSFRSRSDAYSHGSLQCYESGATNSEQVPMVSRSTPVPSAPKTGRGSTPAPGSTSAASSSPPPSPHNPTRLCQMDLNARTDTLLTP